VPVTFSDDSNDSDYECSDDKRKISSDFGSYN
jgi:hypothetical protein